MVARPKSAIERTKQTLWRARVAVERARAGVRVRGAHNVVTFDGARVPGLDIQVLGEGNRIRIPASCYLRGLTIRVAGSHNEIVFGETVKISLGAKLVVNDDGGKLAIGHRTTMESVRLEVAGGAATPRWRSLEVAATRFRRCRPSEERKRQLGKLSEVGCCFYLV